MFILTWILIVTVFVGSGAFVLKITNLLFQELDYSYSGGSRFFKYPWQACTALWVFIVLQVLWWVTLFHLVKTYS